jgi:hypothetical protein
MARTQTLTCRFAGGVLGTMFMLTPCTPALALPHWQPSDSWSVQMQADHCVAAQTFIWNSEQLQLGLEINPTSSDSNLYIITNGNLDGYGWIHANLGIGNHWMKDSVLEEIPSTDKGHIIYKWNVPEATLRELESAQHLQIVSDPLHVDLPVAGLETAKAGLRECDSKLLAHWGLTPEHQARIVSFPTLKALNFTSSDYPRDAAMRGASAT